MEDDYLDSYWEDQFEDSYQFEPDPFLDEGDTIFHEGEDPSDECPDCWEDWDDCECNA